MSQQEPHLLHQLQEHLARESADIDFEAVEQLLRHSREVDKGNGSNMAVATEHRTLPDFATSFAITNEDPRFGGGLFDHKHEREQTYSADPQTDAQTCPVIDPPALGQVCR